MKKMANVKREKAKGTPASAGRRVKGCLIAEMKDLLYDLQHPPKKFTSEMQKNICVQDLINRFFTIRIETAMSGEWH